jgi:glycerol uptake facilitator-like aquaporin
VCCRQAALRADQNAKLSIFATRPAIYVPLYNFLAEAMGTAMLILGALMVELVVGHPGARGGGQLVLWEGGRVGGGKARGLN